ATRPAPTSTPAPAVPEVTPPAAAEATLVPPSAVPAGPLAQFGPFDVAAQAAAIVPAQRGDLDRAGEWNRYTLAVEAAPATRTLSGSMRLEYVNRDSVALDRVYFHLYPNLRDLAGQLVVNAVNVDGASVAVNYEARRYLLRVDLPQPLQPGAPTTISLDFATTTPINAGKSAYGAFNLQNGVFALASSYPIAAMVRDGVWDIATPDVRGDLVNSETALYDVTVLAPVDWKIAGTGLIVDGRLDAGKQVARIVSGPQRDFMLVLSQLQAVSGTAGDTKVTSYYRPGEDAAGKAALDVAIRSIELYNRRFGAYPLAEFDLLPVDAGTFLGVEYPGMTLIEHKLYASLGTQFETTIAHEVAHQWWYSTIGNNVQREAWLDEALATYSQVVYAEAYMGPEAAQGQLDIVRESYRRARTAGRDTAVSQPNTAIRSYFSIVYAKGALFFQALRGRIGDDAFFRALQDYYGSHRYGIATGADLMGASEAACACELDDLYNSWILSDTPVDIP
ncbi:MAG TPA: M1 family metallopeptidase, partial [Roseiflexaceae bacterium]|nr:M1 family metallopeptidase [Roseiflexaceae bacterium]